MTPSTNLGATPRTTSGGGTNVTKSTSFNIVVKSSLPTYKSFSELTDKEFLQIVQALDNNLITTADLNWKVEDSRSVSLNSFTSYSNGIATAQKAQTAQLVILNVGGKTFRGNGTYSDGTACHYVIGFKDNVAASNWSSDYNITYADSFLKIVDNNVYNALPSDVKACFKKFDVVTGTSDTQNATTQQYFTSPAAKEIFGGSTASSSGAATSYSYKAEFNALSQFTYYTTANNRKHSNLSTGWWERSRYYDGIYDACFVCNDGSASNATIKGSFGVSPYGCI